MKLQNTSIAYTETDGKLTVSYPTKQNPTLKGLYTFLLIVWAVLLFLFIYLLINPPIDREWDQLPGLIRWAWYGGIFMWLYLWIRKIGKSLWRWCQFYTAKEEIIEIDDERVSVLRPVGRKGLADGYAREHVTPFHLSDKYKGIGFQYGNIRNILFATGLPREEQEVLLQFLNARYFPFADGQDDEEDDDWDMD